MQQETNQLTSSGATIFITVKVADLFNSGYPSPNVDPINEFTQLSSANSNAGYGQPKDNFNTIVQKNDTVVWIIGFEDNSEKKDYALDLVCIAQKSGSTNFFDYHPLVPTSKIILAKAINAEPDTEYIYYVIFTITERQSGDSHTYAIDPKLLAKPSR